MPEAMKPGLSVEECVGRLKRYHYAFKRLHQIFTAPHHRRAHLRAEDGLQPACASLRRTRLRPPQARRRNARAAAGPRRRARPEPGDLFRRNPRRAHDRGAACSAFTRKPLPALKAALERHLRDTNPLADHPTVRLCRFALLELDDMLEFGARSVAALVDSARREHVSDWLSLLEQLPRSLPAGWTVSRTQRSQAISAPVFRPALPIRPRSPARRALSRSLQHGRQRRGVPLRRAVPARAQDADDVLQAAARDGRARDDGQHHHRDDRQAVGVLPRPDPPALGRGAPRDDGRRWASQTSASIGRPR